MIMLGREIKSPILPCSFKAINGKGKLISIEMKVMDSKNPQELVDFARVMAITFARSEPLTIAANLTEEDVFQEILMYLQYAKKDKLSLVLVNKETENIIGGIIGRDFYNDENEDPFINLPNKTKYQPIFSLLDISKEKFIKI